MNDLHLFRDPLDPREFGFSQPHTQPSPTSGTGQPRIANERKTYFVKFPSHRARDYGLRFLDRKPKSFYSLARKNTGQGIYEVTKAEIERMRAYSSHARFTVIRNPENYNLAPCWKML